ncbi:TPA: hypothetical protein ACH5M0_001651 [Escherichia coli]
MAAITVMAVLYLENHS